MNPSLDRRQFLRLAGSGAALAGLPLSIQKALAIPANNATGTVKDVEHVVILMQENRSFDHYFGTYRGVRGFGERFPIPLATGKNVWHQTDRMGNEVLPYHLDQSKGNAQRVSGTPHSWVDAHFAWFDGRTGFWPGWKEPQSMGYYTEAELPFQFALAEAFTLCDAYHCGIHSSTNPNRLFMFAGSNDGKGVGGGPVTDNSKDDLGPSAEGYTYTSYAERLEAAGVSWKVYQDMADNFTDNSLEGFKTFREAFEKRVAEPNNPLLLKGLTTTLTNNSLDGLKNDVLAGKLPQVSYVVGPAAYSEHTGPSSPVQGAWYTQQVIEALTADPAVWSRTVLLVMFDENDGFFDHLMPPCAPSLNPDGSKAGASTVDDSAERQGTGQLYDQGWVFGPGPRVPMYVVSPWSRGARVNSQEAPMGWVNSQCFDHTSIVQFLEKVFGVMEPNISPYRRAICGDLTSCFNFVNPNDEAFPALPSKTKGEADSLRAQQEALAQIAAPTNAAGTLPKQTPGARPSRALPYELYVTASRNTLPNMLDLTFASQGKQGAVFHVYDLLNLAAIPRRYAVESCKTLTGSWATTGGQYDLFVIAPNGFHRRFAGTLAPASPATADPEIDVCYDVANGDVHLKLHNRGGMPASFTITPNAYFTDAPLNVTVAAGAMAQRFWTLKPVGGWYDFTVIAGSTFSRRFAGRVETGRHSVSDPAFGL